MRRVSRALVFAALAVASGCSLLTSLSPLGDAGVDASVDGGVDGASDAADGANDVTTDAAEASADITGCDAAGLIAYYPFYEGAGNQIHDCSPNQHFATLNGMYTWSTYADAGSIVLSANDAGDAGTWAADTDTSHQYDFAGSATVALWVRIDEASATPQRIVNKRANNQITWGWALQINPDATLSFLVGTGNANPSQLVTLGQWTHVAAVWHRGADITMYVNGTTAGVFTYDGGAPPNPSINMFLGQFENSANMPDGNPFYGAIASLHIFNWALAASDVQTLASQP